MVLATSAMQLISSIIIGGGVVSNFILRLLANLYPGKQTEREKGTTINSALRLAAKRHESAEFLNLTRTVY